MLTLVDFFCGAGGSSQGAAAVPGVRVKLAANHWDRDLLTAPPSERRRGWETDQPVPPAPVLICSATPHGV